MMVTGKCPKCEKVVHNVEVDAIDVTVNSKPAWKGVSFVCHYCKTILGVGIDPIALKADVVAEVLKGLSKH